MWRRLGIVGVLLLGLSGFISSAWACAAMAQNCCPAGEPPCGTQNKPSLDGIEQACCAVQVAATHVLASVSLHDHEYLGAQSHPDPYASSSELSAAEAAPNSSESLFRSRSWRGTDQQLLYLMTGRLRL